MQKTQNLNPQNLTAGETCREGDFFYLGFACGTSVWQQGLAWSDKDKQRAKTENCGLCCCSDD